MQRRYSIGKQTTMPTRAGNDRSKGDDHLLQVVALQLQQQGQHLANLEQAYTRLANQPGKTSKPHLPPQCS